jgi:hypothetical protein
MKRVYFWHLKALGFCNRQMRRWCKAHDVSWRELCREGIDANRLLTLDSSSMAQQAVDYAESTGWSETPIRADGGGKSGRCV